MKAIWRGPMIAASDRTACSERAAWSYEAPRGSMRKVDRWIGFWEDVGVVNA